MCPDTGKQETKRIAGKNDNSPLAALWFCYRAQVVRKALAFFECSEHRVKTRPTGFSSPTPKKLGTFIVLFHAPFSVLIVHSHLTLAQ